MHFFKILVHIHIYYKKQLDNFLSQLKKLEGYDFDLYITAVDPDAVMTNKIKAVYPDAVILKVNNYGYDIAPFMQLIQTVDLNKYEYILKLHTKRISKEKCRVRGNIVSRKLWRKGLIHSLIGSRHIVDNNFEKLQKDPRLGMIGCRYLISDDRDCSVSLLPKLQKTMQELGYENFSKIRFVAGSMFLVRCRLLKNLLKLNLSEADFAASDPEVKDNTMAHVLERVLGCMVVAQGYDIRGFCWDLPFICKSYLYNFTNFMFQKKITHSDKMLIKALKLPIVNCEPGFFEQCKRMVKAMFYHREGGHKSYRLFYIPVLSVDKTALNKTVKLFSLRLCTIDLAKKTPTAGASEIAAYWKKREMRKASRVYYTAVTGGYDRLIDHKYLDVDADYVCFTDNPRLLRHKRCGIWEIRPLAFDMLDNTKNARWHKTHPQLLFPDYEISVWVDGNLNILTPYLQKLLLSGKGALRVPVHYSRNCVYEEIKAVVSHHKEQQSIAYIARDFLLSQHMPEQYGLCETNIIYRRHGDGKVQKIMDDWWKCIEKYSKRDQLSFTYALWQNDVTVESVSIPNARVDKKNFDIVLHQSETSGGSSVDFSKTKLEDYPRELEKWFLKNAGYELSLENPRTFNEKIQWLKLYDVSPLKTRLTDKYLVRDWVKEKIGEQYLVPLLGVWNDFSEINFSLLPKQFALKCTHGSGWNILVPDKQKLDRKSAARSINKWMEQNFAFCLGLELQYRDIVPRIIAEEFIGSQGTPPDDYKVFCFGGKPMFIQYLTDRNNEMKVAFFNAEWQRLEFAYAYAPYRGDVSRPKNLDEMLRLASVLSEGFPFVRVDFYVLNNGDIKFGEMTFTPASGCCRLPYKLDCEWGKLIHLTKDVVKNEIV